MDNLLRRIRELDRRRIEYFLHAPNTLMQTFEREMREAIGKLSQEIPLNVGAGPRAYLLGKILNIGPDYEAKCEEMLEQSLRANSTRADAWLELGQCAWKRADLDKAHSCFMQALERDRSAKGLCLLSAALRANAGRETEAGKRIQLLGRALNLCQEALEKRKDYAFAWYSLGNTQLARFFALQQIQERDLSLALDSFSNALKSPASFSSSSSAVEDGRRPFINPDLHLNYGQALYYNQDYAMALAQFRQALAIEPHFVQARQQFEGALAYLGQLREAIRRKGRLSQHRLNALLDSFRQQSLPISAQIKLTTPAKNGRNGIHGPTAECSTLDELRGRITETKSVASAPSNGEHQKKPNPNSGNVLAQNFVLSVRCVGQMGNEQPIPVTLICVDRTGQAVGLCVYNCSTKFGALIGDLLTIYNPRLILVKIKDLGLDDVQSNKKEQKMEAKIAESKEGEEEEEEVVLLRITNPRRQLLKNGQPLAADCCAFASLSVETQNVAAAAADGQLEMEAEDQGQAPNPTSTKCPPSVKASGRHRRRK